VRALAEHGYAVVANARRIGSELPGLHADGLVTVAGDVGDPADARRIFEAAITHFDGVDLLVNNAGVFIPKPFAEYSVGDFDRLLKTNVLGFFHLTQHVLAHMVRRGRGHVINITTSLAENPIKAVPSVLPILTKGGLNAATRALAQEYAAAGVRVNAVSPGIIRTPMHEAADHGFLATLHPVGRMGAVEDVVRGVLYLEEASFVTGEILHVDGGAYYGRW